MGTLSTLERKLKPKQLAVVQLVADGMKQTQAYRQVYGCRYQTAANGAYTLMKREDVKAVLSKLQKGKAVSDRLDKIEGEEIVTDVARTAESDANRLAAVKLAAELGGWLAPTVTVNAQVDLTQVLASLPDRPGADDWRDEAIDV